jgi:YD repeat-containing protein
MADDNYNILTKNGGATTVAEFAYDALGRRIRKIAGGVTTLYYHNNNWQVLAETDGSGNTKRWFIYGDYIDEPLRMTDTASGDGKQKGSGRNV